MTWIIFLLELCAICAITAGVTLLINFLEHRGEKTRLKPDHAQELNKKRLDKALKALNTQVLWEKDHDDWVARFDYQSGHFRVRLEKASVCIRLFFFYFFDTPVSYLEPVRSLCNQCTLKADRCRIVYTVNEKTGKVDLHIIDTLTLHDDDATDNLRKELSNIFYWQALFVQQYSELKPSTKHISNYDVEKQGAEWQHELFLIREQEMMHQSEGPNWHEQEGSEFSLGHLLTAALGLSSLQPVSLDIFRGDQVEHHDSADEILSYPIHQSVIKDEKVSNSFAMLRLSFVNPAEPSIRQQLIIDVEDEGQSTDTIYYRVTLCLIPTPLTPDLPVESNDHQKVATSLLLGYDLKGKKNIQEKFNYIWKEAMAKQQKGSTDQLDKDEKLLLYLQSPQLRQLLFESKDLINEKRYYEAIRRLEPVYQELAKASGDMAPQELGKYFEVSYYLGTCYTCLGRYKEGIYYLQPLISTRRISYTEMYINCLVNSHDGNAMRFIDRLLSEIVPPMVNRDGDDEENYIEEQQSEKTFISFLKRRKAYLLVEMKDYDAAEKLLKQMLDEPDSSDFALQELAYIQKNKGK